MCDDSVQVLESELNTPAKNCYRLVVLGSSKVGKTAIVRRFLTGQFEEQYTPTIEDFHRKIYKIKGEVYRLDILDTSGNNPFPAMSRLSILTGDFFLLVYSIDSMESFQEVRRLRQQIIDTKRSRKGTKAVPMVIAGNKTDKNDIREVTLDEVKRAFSSGRRVTCHELSALNNCNIDGVFRTLFENARMPSEMTPSMHRKVTAATSTNLNSGTSPRGLSLRRRISDACGVISPNARRPSLRSDLMQVRTNVLREEHHHNDDEYEDEAEGEDTASGGSTKKRACVIQ
ncbi:GTP-binding protein Rhes-like [Asterias rubens]|uniref:GTP-binding protein Rhes-like n=1 Tax=Asterias rubens TaxID=7604 RepID=UPI0014552278|nr:GTP-binding protein Rhes-like [Asterias rubens]